MLPSRGQPKGGLGRVKGWSYRRRAPVEGADGMADRRDQSAESLIHSLRPSPTDLRKLVMAVLDRRASTVSISAAAITRWEQDDPRNWSLVRDWLLSRGVKIVVQ